MCGGDSHPVPLLPFHHTAPLTTHTDPLNIHIMMIRALIATLLGTYDPCEIHTYILDEANTVRHPH